MRKRNSDLEAMLRPVVADLGYEFWGLERLTEKGGEPASPLHRQRGGDHAGGLRAGELQGGGGPGC